MRAWRARKGQLAFDFEDVEVLLGVLGQEDGADRLREVSWESSPLVLRHLLDREQFKALCDAGRFQEAVDGLVARLRGLG